MFEMFEMFECLNGRTLGCSCTQNGKLTENGMNITWIDFHNRSMILNVPCDFITQTAYIASASFRNNRYHHQHSHSNNIETFKTEQFFKSFALFTR